MYFLALLSGLCASGQSTLSKLSPSNGKFSYITGFNTIKLFAAFLFFLALSLGNLTRHTPTAIYAVIYGCSAFFSTLFGFMALVTGPMAVSSLIASYSVVIPCIFGIAYFHESVGMLRVVGFLMLCLSMMFLKKRTNDNITANKKWAVYIGITFLCNGMCSVVQKLHQYAFPGEFCNEFMVYTMFISFLLFFVISAFNQEKHIKKTDLKYIIPAGILAGLSNYLSLMISSKLNATVLFPLISIFTMICTVTFSKVLFKEKFSPLQIFGIILGVVSVLFLK